MRISYDDKLIYLSFNDGDRLDSTRHRVLLPRCDLGNVPDGRNIGRKTRKEAQKEAFLMCLLQEKSTRSAFSPYFWIYIFSKQAIKLKTLKQQTFFVFEMNRLKMVSDGG
jgi:hypothetical protein